MAGKRERKEDEERKVFHSFGCCEVIQVQKCLYMCCFTAAAFAASANSTIPATNTSTTHAAIILGLFLLLLLPMLPSTISVDKSKTT